MAISIDSLLSSDVKKPTALVHFERDMSPTEQKIMTLLIFHCQFAERGEKGFYYIKKSFIRQFLGWDESNNYPRIYEAFESIFNNSIKWNLLSKDRTFKSLKCKLIVSLLEPTETEQYIGFQLHPELEPIIKDPRVFAKIKLIMMSILAKPKYAFPLYEILSDFYSRGERKIQITLTDLRHSLGVRGVYYENFIAFKKEILKPNLDAINKNTDFRVTYETQRHGRKVGSLTISIERQPWEPPLLVNHLKELKSYYDAGAFSLPLLENVELASAAQQFIDSVEPYHISVAEARKALELHGLAGAIEIRDYVVAEVERRKPGKDPVRDPGAYLARCLRDGFGKRTSDERAQEAREKAQWENERKRQASQEQLLAAVEQIQSEFWSYRTHLVDECVEKMSVDEKEEFEKRFMRSDPLWARRFRETGLESPLVRSAFYNFAAMALLTEEQRDIRAFARSKGVASEIEQKLSG